MLSHTFAPRTKRGTRCHRGYCNEDGSQRARGSAAFRRRAFHVYELHDVAHGLNAYQKATILVSGGLLPLVLLFMDAMGYGYVWIASLVGVACAGLLVYALRNARA